MAWTYDATQASARDRVRHAIGDIDPGSQLRADETIDAIIAAHGETAAIAVLAEGLAAEYAQAPSSFGTTGLSVSWANRVSTWLELAQRYRTAGAVDAGGVGVVQATRGHTRRGEYVREHEWHGWDEIPWRW